MYLTEIYSLADKLYDAGYDAGRKNQKDYDHRDCKEWQDVVGRIVDLISDLQDIQASVDNRLEDWRKTTPRGEMLSNGSRGLGMSDPEAF